MNALLIPGALLIWIALRVITQHHREHAAWQRLQRWTPPKDRTP